MKEPSQLRATAGHIHEFVTATLLAAGTSPEPARSVARALTEASLRGVDSHGLRLLLHYAKVVQAGRVNRNPQLSFTRTGPGTGVLDGDNGFGHHAGFHAIDHAIELVRETGIAAVSAINSSHFGAAGAYALHAAEQGYVALSICNSDAFVLAHDGVAPFHGTNPLAFAAPVAGARPYLVDMATSVMPWNRVQDLMVKGLPLPPDVSVDRDGEPTVDPARSAALLPLGGVRYGYKGAAMASMIEVLSAVITGMTICSRLIAMPGPDLSTHRKMGQFFIVIDQSRFASADIYNSGMSAYLADLRKQQARPGARVLAPGDREWAEEVDRKARGVPISGPLKTQLDELAISLSVARLACIQ